MLFTLNRSSNYHNTSMGCQVLSTLFFCFSLLFWAQSFSALGFILQNHWINMNSIEMPIQIHISFVHFLPFALPNPLHPFSIVFIFIFIYWFWDMLIQTHGWMNDKNIMKIWKITFLSMSIRTKRIFFLHICTSCETDLSWPNYGDFLPFFCWILSGQIRKSK